MPIASIEAGDLNKVWEIRTLGKERDVEARKMLEMAAKQVQPIMRKRKWNVKLLSEFCPSNPALLGLNIDGGREVRVRLRRHNHESEFYPYEDVLGTLLHELTHNVHGPHDAKFYKLLDEITKECEELMAKGITGTGQGFDAPGKRLGGYTHNPPPTNLRSAAAAAAEKRARSGVLMPSGSHRLGGDSEIMKALSPLQAAAMAAERRLKDDLWCAAPTTTNSNDGAGKAKEIEEVQGPQPSGQQLSANEPSKEKRKQRLDDEIVVQDAGAVSRVNRKGAAGFDPVRAAALARAQQGVLGQGESSSYGQSQGTKSNGASPLGSDQWVCNVCTLHNLPLALICAACGKEREMGSNGMPTAKTWKCKFCTLENLDLLDNCEACNQWRFSHGAPIASRGPYVGT